MSDDDDNLIQDFLLESAENLDRLDDTLLALEDDSTSEDLIADVFRTIHTIKGTCGFLEFTWLERLTHAGENLLSLSRDGKLDLQEEHMTVLLQMVDEIRFALAHVEEHGTEPEQQNEALVQELNLLAQESNRDAGRLSAEEGLPSVLGKQLVAEGSASLSQIDLALDAQDQGDGRRIGDILVEDAGVPREHVERAAQVQRDQRASHGANVLRIQVEQLDELMTLVGELVLVRNQVLQHVSQEEDASGAANAHRLDHITTELQEGIMKVRMQPIGHLWSRFPRVVRDLSKGLGKRVRVEMEGKDTELDKSLLEAIGDPLTHVVRNAIDHGLETPEERAAAGKTEEGVLRLRAYHESGHINIVISDDGRGLDLDRILSQGLKRGLVSEDRAGQMTEREVARLIFEPGFSTAEKVTNISGRGVGMDVVRTNIERIGGVVDLTSKPGRGTTLKIRIPLTLAIVPALIVSSGGDRYAIPQVSLVELVRLEGENAQRGFEHVHGSPVHRLRGQLLPLVILSEQLEVPAIEVTEDGEPSVNMVVLQADGRQFGLVVDGINDTEEIVVKPLDSHLKGSSTYAGTTIMGDGQVALILDVLGLAQRAKVVSESHKGEDDGPAAHTQATDAESFLLFRIDDKRRTAIPLSSVHRLEEIDRSEVELSGGEPVVQYRDRIMPLIDVRTALGLPAPTDDAQALQVVVHEGESRCTGLVVDCITDIVEDSVLIRSGASSQGVTDSVVLGGEVTDVLDLDAIVAGRGANLASAGTSTSQENLTDTRQVCTFRLGPHLFGVDVHRVQEVLRYQVMTKVPLSPPAVKGLINLRGQTVTALDLRGRLGIAPKQDDGEDPMNVVLMTTSGIVSVLVDEIGDVLEVETASREDVPETVDREVRVFTEGVFQLEHDLLLILDIEATIQQPEGASA